MKTNLIIFLSVFLISHDAQSQYESIFGETSTSWNVLYSICDYACYETLTVTGDSTINSNSYYKIESSVFSSPTLYLREDETQGKAWFYDDQNNTGEHLLMDLQLELNDTFVFYNMQTNEYEDNIVDSVYFFNNRKHIRLNHVTGSCGDQVPITFIEGVGTSIGPSFYEHDPLFLLCFYKDGVTETFFEDPFLHEYLQGDFPDCEFCTSNTQKINDIKFSIHPNPSSDFIHLDIQFKKQNNNARIIIQDILGRKIHQEEIIFYNPELNHVIPVTSLAKGQYILSILSEEGIYSTSFVVK